MLLLYSKITAKLRCYCSTWKGKYVTATQWCVRLVLCIFVQCHLVIKVISHQRCLLVLSRILLVPTHQTACHLPMIRTNQGLRNLVWNMAGSLIMRPLAGSIRYFNCIVYSDVKWQFIFHCLLRCDLHMWLTDSFCFRIIMNVIDKVLIKICSTG